MELLRNWKLRKIASIDEELWSTCVQYVQQNAKYLSVHSCMLD